MNPIHSWLSRPHGKQKFVLGFLCLAALCLIGFVDFWADYRLLFTVLYILPIAFSTIYVNRTYAIILGMLSVVLWNLGDVLGGAPYPGLVIKLWNDAIIFSLFLIVIFLLDALYQAMLGLENMVEARTQALRAEMAERQYLEHETLDLSERERQTFGHELHDVVCQELTGIAIAEHLLVKRLQEKSLPEAENAREIASMVDRALMQTRSIARGFFTAGFDVMGLAESLRETAGNVQMRTGIQCEVQWQEDFVIPNEDVVMHFFRIAQEAIQNAVNHGAPSLIQVSLRCTGQHVRLTIDDNGNGLIPAGKPTKGLGLRIMAYRAGIIGGILNLESRPGGGTRVSCVIPLENVSKEEADSK